MERAIIHLNVADFAVAVERLLAPRLKDRPVLVAPLGAPRALVYDHDQAAFEAGVRKGMPLKDARRLCRDAAVLSPRPDRYKGAMRDLFRRALAYSPRVEPGEADGHLFVDVTGTSRLFGPPVDVAWRLFKSTKRELGLLPVWAVAPNKLVAKSATRLVKPLGEYLVGAGEEAAFMSPLPLILIPGIEAPDQELFSLFDCTRAGQAARWTRDQMEAAFGGRASFLFETVRGADASPVLPAGAPPPAVKEVHAFSEDTNEAPDLSAALHGLTSRTGCDLRSRRMAAGRLALWIEHTDGVRRAGRKTLDCPTADDFALFTEARSLLTRVWTRRVRICRLGIVADRLVFPPVQAELFPDPDAERKKRLTKALDRVRERFGHEAFCFGRALSAA